MSAACTASTSVPLSARADTYISNDVLSIEEAIVDHVEYTLARSRIKFDNQEAYQATALSLRDRLIESWNDTQQYFKCGPAHSRGGSAIGHFASSLMSAPSACRVAA